MPSLHWKKLPSDVVVCPRVGVNRRTSLISYWFLQQCSDWLASISLLNSISARLTGWLSFMAWAQELIWVVAHTEEGADWQTLLKLYRSLIYSQLNYASFVYRFTRWSYFKELDPIHHEGLRQVSGAFRTSPVNSLYALALETPLLLTCEKFAFYYYTKLKSCPSDLAYDCIFNVRYEQGFEKKSIKPVGPRMEPTLEGSKISLTNTVLDY